MDAGDLFRLVATLRSPDTGCPWDREQTFASFADCIRDEAEELAEAMESGDAAHMREEAGDLLWNLCFVVAMAEENDAFTRDEMLRDIRAKMIRRHPHVFGDVSADSAEDALAAYRAAKSEEPGRDAPD